MTTFTLKIIAIIAMVIDHVGEVFFPEYAIFRIIGRLSFPIFAYLIAEGFVYTKNVKQYLFRLGLFAFLSEIPFDLVFEGEVLEFSYQNVFFTLFLGLITLVLISRTNNIVFKIGMVVAMTCVSIFMSTDYPGIGVLMIVWFYIFREKKLEKFLAVVLLVVAMTEPIQYWCLLSLVLIGMHNGKQGPKRKLFFYLFYPLHLLLIYGIQLLL